MFLDEIHLNLRLIHQNIVRLYDIIPDDNCMVMEYIHGADLKEIINHLKDEGKTLPPHLSAYIIYQVAKGLDYAHSKKNELTGEPLNIIHRDISPENILISFGGGVKLSDFGIAKATMREEKTRTGVLKGKISYMSPEQAEGSADIDQRSDIYSLGIVFYELLTGTKLYEAKSEYKLMALAVSGRIDWRPVDRLDIDISLKNLLKDMLQKDKEKRISKSEDIVFAIDSYLRKEGKIHQEPQISGLMEELFPDRKSMPTLEEMPEQVESQLDTMREEAAQKAEQQGEKTIFDIIRMRSTKYEKVIKRVFAAIILLLLGLFIGDIFYFHHFRVSRIIYGKIFPASLFVKTIPHGAKIFVDGKYEKDLSPCPILHRLRDGSHTIVASLEGYASVDRTVEISEGKPIGADTITLRFQIPIHIETYPPGTRVYIGNNLICDSTPYSGNINYDSTISFKFEHEGFDPILCQLIPENGPRRIGRYIFVDKVSGSATTWDMRVIFSALYRIKIYPDSAILNIKCAVPGFDTTFKNKMVEEKYSPKLPYGKNTITINKAGYIPVSFPKFIQDSTTTDTFIVLKKTIKFIAKDGIIGVNIPATVRIRGKGPYFKGTLSTQTGKPLSLYAGKYTATFYPINSSCYEERNTSFNTERTSLVRVGLHRVAPTIRLTLVYVNEYGDALPSEPVIGYKIRISAMSGKNKDNQILKIKTYEGQPLSIQLKQPGQYAVDVTDNRGNPVTDEIEEASCGYQNEWKITIKKQE